MVAELKQDCYVRALYLNFVHFDFGHRIALADTGGNIELPSVPRAGHDGPFDITFAEWAAPVDAGIIDGVKGSTYIEDCEGLAAHFCNDSVTRLDIGRACHPYELSHCPPPFRYPLYFRKRFLEFAQEAFDWWNARCGTGDCRDNFLCDIPKGC